MCGIFTLLNNDPLYFSMDFIQQQFQKGKARGPEFSKLEPIFMKTIFGFHRLAINGLNEKSNQPFIINNISLICNGEIYNYRELYRMMGNVIPETDSDCEVILHLYMKYGIEQTLTMLDGVFSFILCDYRDSFSSDSNKTNKLYVARDPYGVRPLYQMSQTLKHDEFPSSTYTHINSHDKHKKDLSSFIGFASELKSLSGFCENNPGLKIEMFKPGTYSSFHLTNKAITQWEKEHTFIPYHMPSFPFPISIPAQSPKDPSLSPEDPNDDLHYLHHQGYFKGIQERLINSVYKRCITTERPVACLLSGGLDSSLITALVNEYYKTYRPNQKLETYSIGLAGSIDLKYGKKVAEYLGTQHTEIVVTEDEMFRAIPEVIRAIESYDTTSVRASIGNYLLGKYISTHSSAKVIFNGDGSDELCGGYLYMNNCPDMIEFDKETRRLLSHIHYFDVLRSDKCISSHGLEPRTPFLDRNFVNYYLSIPIDYRSHVSMKQCEKYLLRNSFSPKRFQNKEGQPLLPDEVLWRRKEAFSDGVSSEGGKSFYQILQEKISAHLSQIHAEGKTDEAEVLTTVFDRTIETEKYYYKKIFEEYYPRQTQIVPYFWMPKYSNTNDPSARTLKIYSS